MTNFVPLFTNINSIEIDGNNSDVLEELQNDYSELANPMFASARILLAELVLKNYKQSVFHFQL
jgi:hypothetical protein